MKKKQKKENQTLPDSFRDLFTMSSQTGESFADMFEVSLSENDSHEKIADKDLLKKNQTIPLQELFRTYPYPQASIDLHGYTAAEAEVKTESFVITSCNSGLKTIRIVTGKGLHSNGRPVLPDTVEQCLHVLKKRNLVRTFQWEKQEKHRSGSVIVYLK